MASSTAISLLFIPLLISAVAAQRSFSNISLGSSLTPTNYSSWPSPSGIYAFGFFPQNAKGYAIGVFLSDKTVVWTANRDNNPTVPNDVVSLQLTNNGRLILRRRQGQDVDVINLSQRIASASMLDNGNFVLYNSNSSIIWQSFDHPTNTLLPGQRLRPGEELFSSASDVDYNRGTFRLKMQLDGNLVQYPANTPDAPAYAYYGSSTNVPGSNASLNLDNDGRLYVLNNGNFTLDNIVNGGFPINDFLNLMRLDVDGIFRIYSLSLKPLGNLMRRWSSTADPCLPKGFCGVNAFCIQMDNVPQCQCLPGFDFDQSGNFTAGCSRSFSPQDCRKIDDRLRYEIRAVDNTVWEDNAYQDLNALLTQEDCRQACLDDCNCEASFFSDGKCKKQKLPLRFGRRDLSNSNVALVKVSTEGDSGNCPIKIIKKERDFDILIIGIVFMFVSVLAISFSVIYAHWKRREYKKISNNGEPNLVEEIALRAFTFEDLSRATNDFNEELGPLPPVNLLLLRQVAVTAPAPYPSILLLHI